MFVFNLIISQVSVYLGVQHQVIPRIFLPGGPRPSSERMVWLVLSSMCPPLSSFSSRVLMPQSEINHCISARPSPLHGALCYGTKASPSRCWPRLLRTKGCSSARIVTGSQGFFGRKMSLNLLSFWQNIYFSIYSLW